MSQTGPFMFAPRAFWGDENVVKMTGDQVAVYMRCLSLQWENGSIPNDEEDLAILLTQGVRNYTVESLTGDPEGTLKAPLKGGLWYRIKGCFLEVEGSPDRLENPRLAGERLAWRAKQSKASADGKKGQRVKKQKGLQRRRDPEGTLKAPLPETGSDPQALPLPSPVPVPVPVPEEKRRGASPKPVALSLPFGKYLGLDSKEQRRLGEMIEAQTWDPAGNQAASEIDEKALRTERIHLLAGLMSMDRDAGGGSPPSAIWIAWRRKVRIAKGSKKCPRGQQSTEDYLAEVKALRALLDRPLDAHAALLILHETAWLTCNWEHIDKKRSEHPTRHHHPSRPRRTKEQQAEVDALHDRLREHEEHTEGYSKALDALHNSGLIDMEEA